MGTGAPYAPYAPCRAFPAARSSRPGTPAFFGMMAWRMLNAQSFRDSMIEAVNHWPIGLLRAQ